MQLTLKSHHIVPIPIANCFINVKLEDNVTFPIAIRQRLLTDRNNVFHIEFVIYWGGSWKDSCFHKQSNTNKIWGQLPDAFTSSLHREALQRQVSVERKNKQAQYH